MSKELVLSDREQAFIEALIKNGGKLQEAAEAANYHPMYAYRLRDRLAEYIPELTKNFLAFNSLKAAKHIVDSIDNENPNPVRLNAARDVLDRANVKAKEENNQPTIKANIFILPEKREIKVIDHEPSQSGDY